MDAVQKAKNAGIKLSNWSQGSRKTMCHVCSETRKKKKDPCLSVIIDRERVGYNCWHCDAKGAFFDDHDGGSFRLDREQGPGSRGGRSAGLRRGAKRFW